MRPPRFERAWVQSGFTGRQRRAQLSRMESLCGELARLYTENGGPRRGAAFAARAGRAAELQWSGWVQDDLNELGGQFPDGGDGINPKAVDSGFSQLPWHSEAARLHWLAKQTADDLRAVARLRQRWRLSL